MNLVDLIESISIIVASVTATIGIFTWRSEARWKRKYELAEDVLSRFYEAHQVLKIIRSPFGHSNEGKTRKRSESETEEEREIYDRAYVVFERFQDKKEAVEKLQSLKFRFMTVFGKEHEKLFNELNKIMNEVFHGANEIARLQLRHYQTIGAEERGREIRDFHKVIYSTLKIEDDPIEQRIVKLIEDVEKVCKKVIGEK